MRTFVAAAAVAALCACSASTGGAPGAAVPQTASQAPAHALADAPHVFIKGRSIMITKDGKTTPLYLKGVDYEPIPVCDKYIETPLSNANRDIWQRDLKIMRDNHVNAVKVYNSHPDATIGDFLNAAYNNGKDPIYTILSIQFDGNRPLDPAAVASLVGQYRRLTQVNGVYPSVIGVSIGSEMNSDAYRSNPDWWAGLSKIAAAAKEGFRLAGYPDKFVTTTMVDDGFITEREGEKNHFPVDVWGIDFYRGPTFGVAFSEYKKVSNKPLIVAEWGTPVAYHPDGAFNKTTEWPADKISQVNDYLTGLEKELYANSSAKGGVANGGFYFEYSDEWIKAGDPCKQLPGPDAVRKPQFVGGYDDQAWYGLNSIAAGSPNVLTPRPEFIELGKVWAQE